MNSAARSMPARTRFEARATGPPGATSLAQSRSNRPDDVLPGDTIARWASRRTRSPCTWIHCPPRQRITRCCWARPRDHVSKRSPSISMITRVLDGLGWGSAINCPHPVNGPNWSGASSIQLCCECTPAPTATTVATANQRHPAWRAAASETPTSATPTTAATGALIHTATAVTSARPMIAGSPTPTSLPGASPSAGCIVVSTESS